MWGGGRGARAPGRVPGAAAANPDQMVAGRGGGLWANRLSPRGPGALPGRGGPLRLSPRVGELWGRQRGSPDCCPFLPSRCPCHPPRPACPQMFKSRRRPALGWKAADTAPAPDLARSGLVASALPLPAPLPGPYEAPRPQRIHPKWLQSLGTPTRSCDSGGPQDPKVPASSSGCQNPGYPGSACALCLFCEIQLSPLADLGQDSGYGKPPTGRGDTLGGRWRQGSLHVE